MALYADVISRFDEKGFNQATKSTDTLGKKFKDMGDKAGLAFAGIAAGGLAMAKGAAEDEAAAAKLAKTLENVTGATMGQVAAVEDYITKTAMATGVSDDKLRPAFEKLVTATGSVDEAQKLMNLSLDAAAGSGQDVEAVTKAVAKAVNGSDGAMKKLIPTFQKGDDVTKALSDTFGGQMAVHAETAQGKLEIMNTSLSEAQESIGYALLPVLKLLVGMLQDMAPFITENGDAIGKFLIVAGGIAGVIFAAVKAWEAYQAIVVIVETVQAVLNGTMALNPIALIVIAVAGLVAGLVLLYKNSDTFRGFIDGIWDKVKKFAGWIADFAGNIGGWFGKAWGFIRDTFDKIVSGVSGFKDILVSPFKSAFNAVAKIWNNTLGKIKFKLPDWLPGIGGKEFGFPKIPELAKGGIVNRPTLALIGEAGPEAVVPLSKGRGYGGINITINGAVDAEGTARSIQRILQKSAARTGPYTNLGIAPLSVV